MTAARLNGNITNIVDALAGGTKDINALTLEIGSTTVIDNSENFISTGKHNLNVDGTAIDAAGAFTYGAAQDAAIYWDGSANVMQHVTALTNSVSYNKFSHITSGTPATGIGVGLQLEVETSAGNNEIGVVLDAVTTDATAASEDFDFVIKCMAAGAAASEVGRFQSDGKLDLVSGAEYQIAGTDVLSATTLGSGVVASSLTSVGTLTSLTVDNVVINGNDISSSSGNLTITPVAGSAVVIDGGASFDGTVLTGLTALTSTALTGTLQTAAQANVTSLGTLTSLTVSGTTNMAASDFTYPPGHFTGFETVSATDTAHDITISAGKCRAKADDGNINLTSALTKQLDATFAVGDDAGGLAAALTIAADTTYYVHAIGKSDGSAEIGFDTSATATNLLADSVVSAAGYTTYKVVWAFKTDGSANINAYDQSGDYCEFRGDTVDINDSTPATSKTNVTLSLPTADVVANFTANLNHSSTFTVNFFGSGMSDVAPTTGNCRSLAAAAFDRQVNDFQLRVASSTIAYRSSVSSVSNFLLFTRGYWFDRSQA
jgi:hypothetical protein